MLYRFLYLDEPALDGYLSGLEDGLRVRSERSSGARTDKGGSVDAKLVKASAAREQDERQTSEVADTPHSRFARLLQLAEADPELAGWNQLSHLEDLADTGYGALISAECDLFVPDAVRMLTREGGAIEALDTMSELLPLAQRLGLDTEGIPSADEMRTMSGFISQLSSDTVFVGEDDASAWKVAGKLASPNLRDSDVEGYAQVVGKVAKRWTANHWKPLLALPGASLLPRNERRALESRAPTEEDADQFLQGPAVMLDVLAIYR